MACPHMYFVRYLLGVYEVEEPADEITITPLDRAARCTWRSTCSTRRSSPATFRQPDSLGLDRSARRRARGDLRPRRRRHRTRRAHRSSGVLGRRTRTDAAPTWPSGSGATANRCATGGVRVISSERRFGDDGDVTIALPSGRSLALKGSIDRVDVAADGTFVVTDHKTGGDRNVSPRSPTTIPRVGHPAPAAVLRGRGAGARRAAATRRSAPSTRSSPAGEYKRIGYMFTPDDLGRGGGGGSTMSSTASSPGSTRRCRNAPRGDRSRRACTANPTSSAPPSGGASGTASATTRGLQRWFADPDADDDPTTAAPT